MNTFQKYLVEEFAEDYQEGLLTRREALKLIASVTGSLLLANSILAACVPIDTGEQEAAAKPSESSHPAATNAQTPTTESTAAPTDSPSEAAPADTAPEQGAIWGQDVQFPSPDAALTGYLTQPAGEGQFPVALVCHENRGLTEHIKDVTRRLAQRGYTALAVDLLSRAGGSSAMDSSAIPGVQGNTSPEQFVEDFLSGWGYLKTLPAANAERVGMVGFCFGGGVT